MNKVYLIGAECNAYLFLEKFLKEKFNIVLPEIKKGSHGKPYFENLRDIHFNVSHSANMQAVAIGDCEVGVDIEKLRRADLRVAKRFTKAESDYINSKDSDNRFFEIWTKKEAYLKYKGIGLSGGLNSFNVFEIPEIINTVIIDGYVVSVCSEKEFIIEVVK